MSDPAQALVALAKANEVRLARGELRRAIRTARTSVVAVLEDLPSSAATMCIVDLLMAQRRWGPSRARNLLSRLQIGERRTLASLTERQRRIICERLRSDEPSAKVSALPEKECADGIE